MYRDDMFLIKDNKKKEKNNIVFLDVNGVIQPWGAQERFEHDMDKTKEYLSEKYNDKYYLEIYKYDIGAAFYDWDFESLGILRNLLESTKAKIVFHSDWEHFDSLKNFEHYFKMYDMDKYVYDRCSSIPYDYYTTSREERITNYLNNFNVDNYVVFDDDTSPKFEDTFKNRFRRTHYKLKSSDGIYAYLAMLGHTPSFWDEKLYLHVDDDNAVFKKEFINAEGLKALKLKLVSHRDYPIYNKEHLEMALSMIKYRYDVDFISIDMNNYNISDLNFNAQKDYEGYYMFDKFSGKINNQVKEFCRSLKL